MSILNYIAMQGQKIKNRHVGETFLFGEEGDAVIVNTRSVTEILNELNAMQGLNVVERERASANTRRGRAIA